MESFKNLLRGGNRSFLMAVSMLLIMAFHFSMYGNLLRFPPIDFLFGTGYLGVDVFLFLSSYGLCFSLNKHGVKGYYLRRLRKLYPLYLLYLALFFLFFYRGEYGTWFKIAVFQITGLVSFTKIDIEWFIPVLTLLYLAFPLLYRIIEKLAKQNVWMSCALVTALSVISPALSNHMFNLFPPRFAIIVLGVLTFFYTKNDNQDKILALFTFCALLGLCFIGGNRINVSQTGSLLIPLILYSIGQINVSMPTGTVFGFIGAHTLEIYLAQNLAFNHFMAHSSLSFITTSIISLGIVVVGTFVFYYFQQFLGSHLFSKVNK